MILFIIVPLLILAGLLNILVTVGFKIRFKPKGHTSISEVAKNWRNPRQQFRAVSFEDIFNWWEQRRIAYNVIVGVVGLVGSFLLFQFANHRNASSRDILLAMSLGALAYGVGANVCYTAGQAVEFLAFKYSKFDSNKLGSLSFSLGVAFSMILTFAIPLGLIAIINLFISILD